MAKNKGSASAPQAWDLEIRQEDSRTNLQSRFRGSESRGISAPAAEFSPTNIMLWWSPTEGERYGYADGWSQDKRYFYYSGTGQSGDQHFAHPLSENQRVRDHAANNDRIRLLKYLGKNWVRYVAELRLDDFEPWRWIERVDQYGIQRRVIEFRFTPLGPSDIEDSDLTRPVEAPAVNRLSVAVWDKPKKTELETLKTPFARKVEEMREQIVRAEESALVHDFSSYLRDKYGLHATGLSIPTKSGVRLRADLYVEAIDLLVEAKSSAARSYVREGIGQLLDYKRYVSPTPQMCLLTAGKPEEDLCDLLGHYEIKAAWRYEDKSGFQFVL